MQENMDQGNSECEHFPAMLMNVLKCPKSKHFRDCLIVIRKSHFEALPETLERSVSTNWSNTRLKSILQ